MKPSPEPSAISSALRPSVCAIGAAPTAYPWSRRYAVFEHRGHVSTLFDTYAAIWNEALEQHGWAPAPAPVIERHAPSFDPQTGEGGLSLWIPLAD
jgi:hypothetical protein